MTIAPKTKQVLSGLLVGVGSAAAVAVEQAIANPPFTLTTLWHAAAAGAFAGLVHYLPAFGTADAATQKQTGTP